jgi:hypothetical protein
MNIWKTWSDVCDNIVVEEGLTNTLTQWTMHWRRVSGVLASRYRMWWRRVSECSIRGIKLAMKNHISLSVNLYWIKISSDLEFKSANWSYMGSIPSHDLLRVNAKARSNVATLIKSKNMKWWESILCKLKLQKCILYLILSICMSLYQEGYHIDCQQSLSAQHSLKPRWDDWNTMASYTTHLTELEKIR